MKDLLTMTRYELLEACNDIAQRYGGRRLGCVSGYRNQWLVAVELRDMQQMNSLLRSVVALAGKDPQALDLSEVEEHVWIRLGFCQSSIQRAPDGGFTLTIDYDVLQRCRTRAHVMAYFQTMLGRAEEREAKHREWEAMVDAAAVENERLRAAFRLTQELQEYAEVFGGTVQVVQS